MLLILSLAQQASSLILGMSHFGSSALLVLLAGLVQRFSHRLDDSRLFGWRAEVVFEPKRV
jgi:hypothetical protein